MGVVMLNKDKIDKYKLYYDSIAFELKTLIEEFSFLKKMYELKDDIKKSMCFYAVYDLYKVVVKYSVLSIYKIFYDSNRNTITIDKLHNLVMENIVNSEDRENLQKRLNDSLYYKGKQFRKEQKNAYKHFRTQYIAHRLENDFDKEFAINIECMEMFIKQGIDILDILTLYDDTFYERRISYWQYYKEYLYNLNDFATMIKTLSLFKPSTKSVSFVFFDSDNKGREDVEKYNKEISKQYNYVNIMMKFDERVKRKSLYIANNFVDFRDAIISKNPETISDFLGVVNDELKRTQAMKEKDIFILLKERELSQLQQYIKENL